MKIQVFLLLPEMIDSKKDFDNIVQTLYHINSDIRHNEDISLHYDVNNIKEFLENSEELIGHAQYLDKPTSLLKNILNKTSRNWREHSTIVGGDFYGLWDLKTFEIQPKYEHTFAEIIERHLQNENDGQNDKIVFLLLNLDETISSDRSFLAIFKDSTNPRVKNLPRFIHLDYITQTDEFLMWYQQKQALNNIHFTLLNKMRFEKTNFFWQKQRIYKERETGYHWYFDYFHKDNKIHYEVFDETGEKHLGEADEEGVLDSTKTSNSKKISHIF